MDSLFQNYDAGDRLDSEEVRLGGAQEAADLVHAAVVAEPQSGLVLDEPAVIFEKDTKKRAGERERERERETRGTL